jgi:uncharacterized protein (TIGR00156 family)
MKTTEFSKSILELGKHRRILFGGVLVMAVVAVAHAHGERESERGGIEHTEFAEKSGRSEIVIYRIPVPIQDIQGGFIGPIVTAAEARTLADESPVRLQGKIIQALKENSYEFQDSTGTITVEINRRAWNGVSVANQDTVEITGKIDKFFSRRSVEVRQIQKVMQDTTGYRHSTTGYFD